jgi:hypothetical protein
MNTNDRKEFLPLGTPRYGIHVALQNHDRGEEQDGKANRPSFWVTGRKLREVEYGKWNPVTGPIDPVPVKSDRSTPGFAPIKSQSRCRSARDRRPMERHAQSKQGVEPSQGAEIGWSPAETSTGSDPSPGAECPSEVRTVARMVQGKYGFADIRVSESKVLDGDANVRRCEGGAGPARFLVGHANPEGQQRG